MQEQESTASLRRRRVTRKSLVAAGIELSLSKLTVKALAEQHGVSIVTIYNNIESLDALKVSVAEEILARWALPVPEPGDGPERSLTILSNAVEELVHDNPGIARYLADLDKGSAMLGRIVEFQRNFVRLYGLPPKQAAWAVVTVVEHAISVAEFVHVAGGRPKWHTEDDYRAWSTRAVIVGAMTLILDPQFLDPQFLDPQFDND